MVNRKWFTLVYCFISKLLVFPSWLLSIPLPATCNKYIFQEQICKQFLCVTTWSKKLQIKLAIKPSHRVTDTGPGSVATWEYILNHWHDLIGSSCLPLSRQTSCHYATQVTHVQATQKSVPQEWMSCVGPVRPMEHRPPTILHQTHLWAVFFVSLHLDPSLLNSERPILSFSWFIPLAVSLRSSRSRSGV